MSKAATKAAKLRAKRGRNQLPPTDREPNGRKSRRQASMQARTEMTEQEARSVVVERRIRQDNIVPFRDKSGASVSAETQAADPRRGYVLGRLRIAGRITERQHEAGVRFAKLVGKYYSLKGLPAPNPQAQNMFAIRGYASDDDEEAGDRARAAQLRVTRIRDMMQGTRPKPNGTRVQIDDGRRILKCIDDVIVHDLDAALGWNDAMIGYLKNGLNIAADAMLVSVSVDKAPQISHQE